MERIWVTKIIKMADITIKEIKNKFTRLEKNLHACSWERTKRSLKMGIMAAEIAPMIRTKDMKSGILKAA